MNKLILIIPLLSGLLMATTVVPPDGRIKLTWSGQNAHPSNTFLIYASPDMNAPLSQWPYLTNSVGTTHLVGADYVLPITIQPGQMYFYVIVSNFWGVANPSNVASTPPLPGDLKVGVGR